MHCLFGCLGFLMPRVAIVVLWLSTGYMERAFETLLWPLLGFVFMPLTTLAFAWVQNDISRPEVRTVFIVIAVLIDLGILGKGSRRKRRRSDED